ncbi:hypothetical protein [Parabacteroides distasonis]|uniref:hypothetical protein n=1 Tax=Parabacteroides distasonis TaxID=823 RepID=UPI00321B62F5
MISIIKVIRSRAGNRTPPNDRPGSQPSLSGLHSMVTVAFSLPAPSHIPQGVSMNSSLPVCSMKPPRPLHRGQGIPLTCSDSIRGLWISATISTKCLKAPMVTTG